MKDWFALLTISCGLIGLVVFTLDPVDMWLKNRDDQRIKNLGKIQKAIDLTLENGGILKGESGNLFRGDSKRGLRLASLDKNFVGINLSDHFPILPVDPLNNENYFFEFVSDGIDYEIRCQLEAKRNEFRTNGDGGDDDDFYEVGTRLDLL